MNGTLSTPVKVEMYFFLFYIKDQIEGITHAFLKNDIYTCYCTM